MLQRHSKRHILLLQHHEELLRWRHWPLRGSPPEPGHMGPLECRERAICCRDAALESSLVFVCNFLGDLCASKLQRNDEQRITADIGH